MKDANTAGPIPVSYNDAMSSAYPLSASLSQQRQHRWVLHCDLDAFFSSVEQLTRPTLRGRPVLVGGRSGRGVVAGTSYEARALGCHSAMPMHQASRLIAPRGVVVPPRGAVYRTASKRIFHLLRQRHDIIEQLSIDEAFLEPPELIDATAGETEEYCERLRHSIYEQTGLTLSFGAGSGKQYAKIASGLAKPDGVCVLPHSELTTLIHPLPVRKLWGVGPVAESKLHAEGIVTIGDLAALSERDVRVLLGNKNAVLLHEFARGFDDRPVQERAIAKQISSENTYLSDLTDRSGVLRAVDENADDAHRRLLLDGRAARTVTVKHRFSNMTINSRSATLPYATTDLRTLSALAHRLALDPAEAGAIRLIGVSFSGLSTVQQEALFPELDGEVDVHEDVRSSSQQVTSPLIEEDAQSGVVTAVDATALPVPRREDSDTSAEGDVHHSEDGTEEFLEPRLATAGTDVKHPDFGHGWVQGSGKGKITVRFETRITGPGRAVTFPWDDHRLELADPCDSLDWDLS